AFETKLAIQSACAVVVLPNFQGYRTSIHRTRLRFDSIQDQLPDPRPASRGLHKNVVEVKQRPSIEGRKSQKTDRKADRLFAPQREEHVARRMGSQTRNQLAFDLL